ncbi:U3 small nucleolar RNA-associated protein [Babesia ovis]|uniref:U3 small nucleolar RNA-associated protein n=1 Tax=Babesia ovis TaxID=5869 RepID=A0A9W5TA80_BABOV|nr:U3 small nucleolar RNA-associated protein [Babesia ovis]
MARSRLGNSGHTSRRKKSRSVMDEEISEDEAFNEEEEAKYGRFFQSKRSKTTEDTGELWDCLIDGGINDDIAIDSTDSKDVSNTENVSKRSKTIGEPESYDEFIHQEDDVGTLVEGTSTTDLRGFEWACESTEDDSKFGGLLKKYREIQEDLPEVFREQSRAKTSCKERSELYNTVNKDLGKRWEPILRDQKRGSTLCYGTTGERSHPTAGSLSQIQGDTDLEKELRACENSAYERALYLRELRKQKRVNRIKSKNWHKREKKRDLELYAKLIEKSNDTELTKELLESFETKRSKYRTLRKRAAQEKWAKLAMRFGDRSVLKQISSTRQQLVDDISLIKDTIDAAAEVETLGTDDSSVAESESDEEPNSVNPQDEVLAKLQIISNPKEMPVVKKGLFALKFMQEGLRSKIAQQDEKGSDAGPSDVLGDQEDMYEVESIESDLEENTTQTQAVTEQIGVHKKADVKVSNDELARAMREIQNFMGGDVGLHDVEAAKAGKAVIESKPITKGIETDTKHNLSVEPNDTTKHDTKVPVGNDAATELSSSPSTVLANSAPTEDTGLTNFIKNIGTIKKSEDTARLAQRLFVTPPDDEVYLSDEEKEETDVEHDKMKGWGNWTGFGIVNVEVNKADTKASSGKKRTVKVSNKREPKLDKYLLHRIPHPYKNKHEYNAKMENIMGPELNTTKGHADFVRPKTHIKIGSIVKPISAQSTKSYVRNMGKAFQRNRTKAKL